MSKNATTTQERQQFAHLTELYFATRKNKRYGRDAMSYEIEWVSNLVRDFTERRERTLRIRHNYAFLTSVPKWREIMATEFSGRLTDHEICEIVIPAAERVLSPYTFNNRKGKGATAAINKLIENIYIASNGYTEPCRIIKLDLLGYFPNALWDCAERCIDAVIDGSGCQDKDYLKWLTMIAVHCNPAAHCEKRTPTYLWHEHIAPEKSILIKPEGTGAAIGRLIWQAAMGLYINDEIIWLIEDCGLLVVCFVDDIVMTVPERMHCYALAHIPELRRRLALKGVRLNERKFYDQPYGHGVEFLGSHIKPFRILLNDKTCERALTRVNELNAAKVKTGIVDQFLSSLNSYTGLLKARTEHKRLMALRDSVSDDWYNYVEWDDDRQCVTPRPQYSYRNRMNSKYHLKLKAL